MNVGFDKRWLLPLGILAASALVALGVVFFEPFPVDRSPADCSGASASDYACQQERYRELVRDSGVEAAFVELKDEYQKNDFVKTSCHPLTHVIGRAAADLYGDVPGAYGRGDDFCSAGYYHGAMETFVTEVGTEKILEEADTLCADPRERQNRSFYHHNCAHGLGHGFMRIQQNELFEALGTCDALADGWERERCSGGVFMENLMAQADPSRPSKYLKPDQPLYPCTEVEDRYKNPCYEMQIQYALKTQGDNFARGFELCGGVEEDSRPVCYQGLGNYGAGQSIRQNITEVAQAVSSSNLCTLGEDQEARSNCVIGAAGGFVLYYESDEQAKAFCESVEADLRALCLQTAEESMAARSG